MHTASLSAEVFAARRARLAAAFGPGTVIAVPAARPTIRNHDVDHEWRQDSEFWYLTGFDEPDCVLVLVPGRAGEESAIFVRPRDPKQETWNGRRAGVERAATRIGVAVAFDIGDFDREFGRLVEGACQVAWPIGRDAAFDQRVVAAGRRHRTQPRLHLTGPDHYVDVALVLSEHRMCKAPEEVELLRASAAITAAAHHEAMRVCRPGVDERQLQAAVEFVFRAHGSERVGYGSIVARGDNATILHYRENQDAVGDGDLVLIDAGAERCYLTADITRTFPASGRFSAAQQAVYAVVLDAQKQCIAACTPDHTILEVHEIALRVLTAGLVALGVLDGEVEGLVRDEKYKPYYMHRTSHWLGMDVHDAGRYHDPDPAGNRSRRLQPGMVLTVEPGLYFASDDVAAPEHLRGIGVRIEDDILVTDGAPEVLTAMCVKEIDEVEAMVGSGGAWVRLPGGPP